MCFDTLRMAEKVRASHALMEMATQKAEASVERRRCMPPKYIIAWTRDEVPHQYLREGADPFECSTAEYAVKTRGGRRRAARLLGGPGRRFARPYPVAYAIDLRGMEYTIENRGRPKVRREHGEIWIPIKIYQHPPVVA